MNKPFIIKISIFIMMVILMLLLFYLYLISREKPRYIPIISTPTPIPFGLTPTPIDQTQADQQYTVWNDTILKKYPWFNKLPVQENDYFVYFDPAIEKVIATIYISSPNIETKNVEQMKNIVIDHLRQVDPNILKYNIEWKIK